ENAVKFTQQGQVLLHVRSLSKNHEDPVLRFEVADTGIGIAEENVKKIFYAAPGRGFDKDKKTTHGLIICRKHAELMGGKIEIKTAPGSGSIFSFTVRFDHNAGTFLQIEQPGNLKVLEEKQVLII